MAMKIPLEEAKRKAVESLESGEHCGPITTRIMWEAYGFDDRDLLWAGIAFQGGIGGYQHGPCGALSGATMCLGLKQRCSMENRAQAKNAERIACEHAAEIIEKLQKAKIIEISTSEIFVASKEKLKQFLEFLILREQFGDLD